MPNILVDLLYDTDFQYYSSKKKKKNIQENKKIIKIISNSLTLFQ